MRDVIRPTDIKKHFEAPCPFCGGVDIGIKHSLTQECAYAYCRICGAAGPLMHVPESGSISDERIIATSYMQWDRRHYNKQEDYT